MLTDLVMLTHFVMLTDLIFSDVKRKGERHCLTAQRFSSSAVHDLLVFARVAHSTPARPENVGSSYSLSAFGVVRLDAVCSYLLARTTLPPCHAGCPLGVFLNASVQHAGLLGFGLLVQVYVPRIQPCAGRAAAEGVRLVQFQRHPDHRTGKA